MKTILIIVGSIVLIITLLMGGCVALNRHIYSRMDCERFNIDNVEVRTGINIPSIKDVECECREQHKTAKFVLDTDLTSYVELNKFELVDDKYYRKGKDEYTIWEASLDMETAELIVDIDYLK